MCRGLASFSPGRFFRTISRDRRRVGILRAKSDNAPSESHWTRRHQPACVPVSFRRDDEPCLVRKGMRVFPLLQLWKLRHCVSFLAVLYYWLILHYLLFYQGGFAWARLGATNRMLREMPLMPSLIDTFVGGECIVLLGVLVSEKQEQTFQIR